MKLPEAKIYETQNADLGTFLMFQGIKLLECRRSDANKKVVILRFLDEKQNCTDLAQTYLNSDFKRFRDINKYLLAKIHEVLRES